MFLAVSALVAGGVAGCGDGGGSQKAAAPAPTGATGPTETLAGPQEVLVSVGRKLATTTKSVIAEQEVDLRFDSQVKKTTTVTVVEGTVQIGSADLKPTDGKNIHLLIPHLPPGKLVVKARVSA